MLQSVTQNAAGRLSISFSPLFLLLLWQAIIANWQNNAATYIWLLVIFYTFEKGAAAAAAQKEKTTTILHGIPFDAKQQEIASTSHIVNG